MDNIKYLIYTFSLLFKPLFFCVTSLLGINYVGSESSNLLIVSSIIVVLLVGICFFAGIRRNFNNYLIFALILILSVVIFYLLESNGGSLSKRMIRSFMAESVPAILVGIDIAKNKTIAKTAKWLEVGMILMTLYILIYIPSKILGMTIGLAEFYQAVSYYSAFAFCINLFFILFGENFNRFSFAKGKWYRIISFLFLFLQIISCLISGGRGGAVLILISIVFLFYYGRKMFSLSKILFFSISVFLSGIFLFAYLPDEVKSMAETGSERTFSYISNNGIDMSNTSNRDIFYERAIKYIDEKPITGYGFIGYTEIGNWYPHNIILEILLQGGSVFLIIIILVLIYLFAKIRRIIRVDFENLIILCYALYPLVMLQFTGSYVMTPMFWFVVTYIIVFHISKKLNRQRGVLNIVK